MVSDSFLGQSVVVGNNISLASEFESEEESQNIYSSLSEKGAIQME
jgi:PhnB protein